MTAIQADSIVRLPLDDNTSDHKDFFCSPWLNEQASKVKTSLDYFCNNLIQNTVAEHKKFSNFEAQCIAELGEKKGKKDFREWIKSLGPVVSYLARGVMKFGRWFNLLTHGEQDIVRQNTQDWSLAWLKRLMKYPMSDILDMAVEGNLKAVVVGGMKEKKRELRVEGYAKIVDDPHDLNLKGKVGRLAYYCEEEAKWLCELPDSELADSEMPDSGLTTSNWFTAEQLEVANKPRNISTPLGKNLKKIEGKSVKSSEPMEQKNEQATDKKNVDNATHDIAATYNQAAGQDEPQNSPRITPDSPSLIVDVHAKNQTNGTPLNAESHEIDFENRLESNQISFAQFQAVFAENQRLRNQAKYIETSREYEMEAELEQKIAQIRIDIEQAALATAESRFRQQLQEKDAELAKLRYHQSSLDGKLILSPQELDDERRKAVAASQQKTALAFQENQQAMQKLISQKDAQLAALASDSNHFKQQLQKKDEELAKLKALQSSLDGKLIFTPQEFEECLQKERAANQELRQELEQQKQELQQALEQAKSFSQSVGRNETTLALDSSPHQEYDSIRTELHEYKSIFLRFFRGKVESASDITPQLAQGLVSSMLSLLSQNNVESSQIQPLISLQSKIDWLESQLQESLEINRKAIKELQLRNNAPSQGHQVDKKLANVNQKASPAIVANPKPKAFVPTPRHGRHK